MVGCCKNGDGFIRNIAVHHVKLDIVFQMFAHQFSDSGRSAYRHRALDGDNLILFHAAGDINRRRGVIVGTDTRGNTRVINAEAPLAAMFGYSTTLRGLTQGRASYSMEPLTYRQAPESIAKAVLEGTS